MVLVFDLDDTLYQELTFVKSGFKTVAYFLGGIFNLQAPKIYKQIIDRLRKKGRGKIFDDVLRHNKIFSAKLVKKCILIYRQHKPRIKLYKDAERCLKKYKNLPIYIVTDGNKTAQINKVKALRLDTKVKKIFITRRYGIINEKPSPHCFFKICSLEKVTPNEVIFIGDDPHKDFIGIKPLGFRTVRVRRGSHTCVTLGNKYEADREIKNLDELII